MVKRSEMRLESIEEVVFKIIPLKVFSEVNWLILDYGVGKFFNILLLKCVHIEFNARIRDLDLFMEIGLG
jgi:hypothetical protein